ncbi:MAG: hypothetical protein ACTHM1_05740 [Solirubrobacteraceae bacterium]
MRSACRRMAAGVLVAGVCILLLAVPAAFGAYSRPFARGFSAGGGMTVNGAGDLLTSIVREEPESRSVSLQVRSPAFETVEPNHVIEEKQTGLLNVAEYIASEYGSGRVYAAGKLLSSYPGEVEVADEGTGALIERWSGNESAYYGVAVDNSTEPIQDPSACSGPGGCVVYVAQKGRIEKFGSKGEPLPFAGPSPCVKGNEIVGVPTEDGRECVGSDFGVPFRYESPAGLAVDAQGDIFTVGEVAGPGEQPAVLEYTSAGVLVRSFTGEATPGIGPSTTNGGWGGKVESVAVDQASDHLLVSVTRLLGGKAEPFEGAVDEFDIASGRYLGQIATTSAGGRLKSAKGLAADSKGDVYVDDYARGQVDVYEPGRFLPNVRLGEARSQSETAVSLHGEVNPESTVNPERSGLTGCEFQYVTEEAFQQNVQAHGGQEEEGFSDLSSGGAVPCAPPAGEVPADSNWHPVQAEVAGLASGVSYRYRLLATSAGALGGSSATSPLRFVAPHAPAVSGLSASGLSSTFAQLKATIDPLGAATSYRFEYVTRSDYEASGYADAASTPQVGIGAGGLSGDSEERVAQRVEGLSPSTAYDARLVASNAYGVTDSETIAFQTLAQAATGLPDNRAYELVTPATKEGSSDMFAASEGNGEFQNRDQVYVGESGQELLLQTKAPFGPFPFATEGDYVFGRHGVNDWPYASLSSPQLGVQSIKEVVVDPENFRRVALADHTGAAVGAEGEVVYALAGQAGGPYTTLHADPPNHVLISTYNRYTKVVGASSRVQQVALEGTDPALCPGSESLDPKATALCEWQGSGSEGAPALELVDANAEGTLMSKCGARIGAGVGDRSNYAYHPEAGTAYHAVSADGSKVFFTSPDPAMRYDGATAKTRSETTECWNGSTRDAPQLYMRTHGTTVQLSAPQVGVSDPTGRHVAEYVGASEDGSKVFFLGEGWLTGNHPTSHDNELYECEIVAGGAEAGEEPGCRLKRVSAGETGMPASEAGAEVHNVPVVAASGAAVYFTAFNVLAEGASPRHEAEELVNLYRYDTTSGKTSYVATVNTYDNPREGTFCSNGCPQANWYATPDGRYLLFATSQELTGYDTAGACATLPQNNGIGNGHCDELYRYDAVAAEAGKPAIRCVSCDPSGAAPVSNALFTRSAMTEAFSGPVRAMSNDGAYVFFDSADPLVPKATNGTLNVYEWHEGAISLVDSGGGAGPSYFLGMSATGSDVFFGTHQKLVAQDTDAEGDIYDARICTSSEPCLSVPSQEPVQCEGDACQSPPAAPQDATPVSATFTGAGNLLGSAQGAKPKAESKTVSKRQMLARALGRCREKPKRQRTACIRRARRRYGAAPGGRGRTHSKGNGRSGR